MNTQTENHVFENKTTGQVDLWSAKTWYFRGQPVAKERNHLRQKPTVSTKETDGKVTGKVVIKRASKSENKETLVNWWDALLIGSVVLLIVALVLKYFLPVFGKQV